MSGMIENAGKTLVNDGKKAVGDIINAGENTVEGILQGLGLSGSTLNSTVSKLEGLGKNASIDSIEAILKAAVPAIASDVLDVAAPALLGLLLV
jgi:hypothetical protein